jgi:hypothetical protein
MIFVHTLGTASIDVGSCSINPTSPRKFALLPVFWRSNADDEFRGRAPRADLRRSGPTETPGTHSVNWSISCVSLEFPLRPMQTLFG